MNQFMALANMPSMPLSALVSLDGSAYQFIMKNRRILNALYGDLESMGVDVSGAKKLSDEIYRYLQHLWSHADQISLMLELAKSQMITDLV